MTSALRTGSASAAGRSRARPCGPGPEREQSCLASRHGAAERRRRRAQPGRHAQRERRGSGDRNHRGSGDRNHRGTGDRNHWNAQQGRRDRSSHQYATLGQEQLSTAETGPHRRPASQGMDTPIFAKRNGIVAASTTGHLAGLPDTLTLGGPHPRTNGERNPSLARVCWFEHEYRRCRCAYAYCVPWKGRVPQRGKSRPATVAPASSNRCG